MSALVQERCVACRKDSPRVTEAEIAELQPQIPVWTLVDREGIPWLERLYRFKDFAQALAFTNKVGALAEEEGHHPALTLRVIVLPRVRSRVFDIMGLHGRSPPFIASGQFPLRGQHVEQL